MCHQESWATIPYQLERETKYFVIRVWKLLPNRHVFKVLRKSPKGKAVFKIVRKNPKGKSLKMTISTSGRLELLQIVSKSDTKHSVSKEARSRRGVNSEIPYRLERKTKHFVIRVWKLLPNIRVFKVLRKSPKGKSVFKILRKNLKVKA